MPRELAHHQSGLCHARRGGEACRGTNVVVCPEGRKRGTGRGDARSEIRDAGYAIRDPGYVIRDSTRVSRYSHRELQVSRVPLESGIGGRGKSARE